MVLSTPSKRWGRRRTLEIPSKNLTIEMLVGNVTSPFVILDVKVLAMSGKMAVL